MWKAEVDLNTWVVLVKLTDSCDIFPCLASLFAEDAEEKAKKEAEGNAYQGTDEKERDEQYGKPGEDVTERKTEKSKEPNPGESKRTDSSKNPGNGTWQRGMSKREAYQGENATRTNKKMDHHHTLGEEKQHVQNGELLSFTET